MPYRSFWVGQLGTSDHCQAWRGGGLSQLLVCRCQTLGHVGPLASDRAIGCNGIYFRGGGAFTKCAGSSGMGRGLLGGRRK